MQGNGFLFLCLNLENKKDYLKSSLLTIRKSKNIIILKGDTKEFILVCIYNSTFYLKFLQVFYKILIFNNENSD